MRRHLLNKFKKTGAKVAESLMRPWPARPARPDAVSRLNVASLHLPASSATSADALTELAVNVEAAIDKAAGDQDSYVRLAKYASLSIS
jgi:hypothetical protein